ncbi:alpha/beta hydrolase [Phocaeicola vulgatus]|nr:alpha/beta hydrolase [Phocaeicola vulgatus]
MHNRKIIAGWIVSILLGSSMHAQESTFPKDTSFTAYQTYMKVKKTRPYIELVKPQLPLDIIAFENIVYSVIPDTPYGKRELHVNIYRKNDKKKYPALLMVHGGGWNSGDRSIQIPMAQHIATHGYVTIPVEYRLRPEAIYPAALYDLKAAVRWVRANAEKYAIDTTRIAISGCSAGGHLASLIGMTNGSKQHEGKGNYTEHSSKVQAVINIDGCVTFISPRNIAETVENRKKMKGKLPLNAVWLGGMYADKKEIWEEASPILWVTKQSAPICFINSLLPRYHDGRDELINKLNTFEIKNEVYQINIDLHPFWLFHPWFNSVVKYTVDFLNNTLLSDTNPQ